MDGVDYSASKTAIFLPTKHRLDWKSRCFFSKVISGPRGRVFKSHHSDQYKCPETVYSCGFRAFLFICIYLRFSLVTHAVTHTGLGRWFLAAWFVPFFMQRQFYCALLYMGGWAF